MTQEQTGYMGIDTGRATSRKEQLFKAGAYVSLALVIGSAFVSVIAYVAERKALTMCFVVVMWGSLLCYFIFGVLCIGSGIRGWAGRLFSAAAFFPLVLFIRAFPTT